MLPDFNNYLGSQLKLAIAITLFFYSFLNVYLYRTKELFVG